MPNHSLAVFLINDAVRGVLGIYEPDIPSQGKTAKRVFFKTFDKSVKKDDLVIVCTNTRHGYTVFKVTDVDVEPNFDLPDQVEWIVSKINTRDHERILSQEGEAIAAIQRAERRKKREEMAKTMMADAAEVRGLAIATPATSVRPPEPDPQF